MKRRTPRYRVRGYAAYPEEWIQTVSDEPERRRSPQHANLRLLIVVLLVAAIASIVTLAVIFAKM